MTPETLDRLIDSELSVPKPKKWQRWSLWLVHLGLLALGWYWFGWWGLGLMIASGMTTGIGFGWDVRLAFRRQKERYLGRVASARNGRQPA